MCGCAFTARCVGRRGRGRECLLRRYRLYGGNGKIRSPVVARTGSLMAGRVVREGGRVEGAICACALLAGVRQRIVRRSKEGRM